MFTSIPRDAAGLPANNAIKPVIEPTYLLSTSGEFHRTLRCRTPGTCDWVFDTPEYRSWHGEEQNRNLHIHGPLGTGKSVLAASVVNHLQETEQDVPFFHFFCPQEHQKPLFSSGNISQQPLASSLIFSWLAQGFKWSKDLESKVQALAKEPFVAALRREGWSWSQLRSVGLPNLWELLIDAFKDSPKLYFAIDDVDAFKDPEDAKFLQLLFSWKEVHPGRIKLLVTSSSTAALANDICLTTVNDNVLQDIRTYVDQQLESFPPREGKETKALIRQRLRGTSFLYSKIALICLNHGNDTDALTEVLDHSSPDLYGLYNHILKSCTLVSIDIPEYRRTVLALLLYSGFRLRRLQIKLALEVLYGPEAQNQDLIRSAFGPLLEFNDDETFSLVHGSFTHFAHDKDRSPQSQALLPVISSTDAHNILGIISLRCMLEDHFKGKQMEDLPNNRHDFWEVASRCMPLFSYAASTWFLHARELPEITGELQDLLLQWVNKRKKSFVLWIRELCRPRRTFSRSNDDFLQSVNLLHIAAWSGSVSMIQLARDQELFYDDTMSDGTSALAIAVSHGHHDVVKFLLDHKVKIDMIDQDRKSPLDQAALHNHVQIARLLLEAGASVNVEDKTNIADGSQPVLTRRQSVFANARAIEVARELILLVNDGREIDRALDNAASQGKIDWIDLILTSPLANVDGTGSDTPLFRAGLDHHVEAIKLLLERGADPNKRSVGVRSHGCIIVGSPIKVDLSGPLHAVSGFNTVGLPNHYSIDERRLEISRECAQILIDAGADVQARGLRGDTPLHLSVSRNLSSVVEVLLQHGADLFMLNDKGMTPCDMINLSETSVPMIKFLIRHGLRLDEGHKVSGKVPFHSILCGGGGRKSSKASLLLPFINNWNVSDNDGNTILHRVMAAHFRNGNLIAKLIRLGVDPRRKNKSDQEPLHLLTQNYSIFGEKAEEVVKILLDAGADLEATDDQNRTPLHHLIIGNTNKPHSIIQFIEKFGADFKAIDKNGNGAMHLFMQGKPSDPIFTELLNLGVDILGVNYGGENLMHILMRSESVKQSSPIPDQIIQRLSDEGVSSTHQDEQGNTPLHLLCQQNMSCACGSGPPISSAGTFMLDLDDGKAIEVKNNDGLRPLQLAVATSAILSERLIFKGASTIAQTKQKQNLLHLAISARQSNIVELLLDHYTETGSLDVVLDQRDEKGHTPLHTACEAICKEAIPLLLKAGASLEIRDDAGLTPLELSNEMLRVSRTSNSRDSPRKGTPRPWYGPAKRGGQMMEIICLLAQAQGRPLPLGGDYEISPEKPPRLKKSPYLTALHMGEYKAFEKCIESGVDFGPNKRKGNEDLLSVLAKSGYSILFNLIAQSLQDPSWPNGSDVVSPYLMSAVSREKPNMPIIRSLVERFNADVNVLHSPVECSRSSGKRSPLHVLARGHSWWNKGAVEYLLEMGADPNVKNEDEDSPLQVAILNIAKDSSISKHIIKSLLNNGANPNQTNKKGLAPLDRRIEDPEVIDLLVQAGGKPNCPDRTGDLLSAIKRKDVAEIQAILANGQDCNRLYPEDSGLNKSGSRLRRWYPLEEATLGVHRDLQPQISMLKLLLGHGANPFQLRSSERELDKETTILHYLIRQNNYREICNLFLDLEGIDIEARDPQGDTLFLAAARHTPRRLSMLAKSDMPKRLRCMELYERGADIRAVNNEEETILHILMESGIDGYGDEDIKRETLSFFVTKCPDFVNKRNKSGFTPFQLVPRRQRGWAWEILLSAGADPLMSFPNEKTALHATMAIFKDWSKWVKRFVEMGGDINSRDGNGETPIFTWVRNAKAILEEGKEDRNLSESEKAKALQDTVRFFEEIGSDLHVVNNGGENLLHALALRDLSSRCSSGNYASNLMIFQIFVRHGLDPLTQNKQGRSALVSCFIAMYF
ncbi:Ankyrin repeat-containing protein [Penicillium manginii]|uniref:Ankyrin repeat-containing protein n=1 Tax=Penicillium manginii TaxID=203109 RepID=UPI0025474177|nr:Ankyrin repeat-containing protein [Penicillium manginii]KAJ5763655.1 Ankyrin repeat-containing protein [Penicillium manginii]